MEISLIGFAIILFLSFVGIPLAYATLAVGFFGFWYVRGDISGAIVLSGQEIFDFSTLFGLSVVPLFILMGSLIQRANISDELYEAGYAWVGKYKGGLAMATVLSCAGFSAVSGSSLATAATMARVAMPPMRKYKYKDSSGLWNVSCRGNIGDNDTTKRSNDYLWYCNRDQYWKHVYRRHFAWNFVNPILPWSSLSKRFVEARIGSAWRPRVARRETKNLIQNVADNRFVCFGAGRHIPRCVYAHGGGRCRMCWSIRICAVQRQDVEVKRDY